MEKRVNDHTLYMRQWREKNREKTDAYQRSWRKAHKAEIALYNKLYREAHPKEHRERNARWREKHPDRRAALSKAACAKQRYPGALSLHDVLGVIQRSGSKCYWCGKEDLRGKDLTLEHLKPVNAVEHLVVACMSCNAARLATKARE